MLQRFFNLGSEKLDWMNLISEIAMERAFVEGIYKKKFKNILKLHP
jgi:hypothetical protein